MFPLTVGGVIGGISYLNPSLIPPAYSIIQPEFNPMVGPIQVDPVSVGVLNGLIYGGAVLGIVLIFNLIQKSIGRRV